MLLSFEKKFKEISKFFIGNFKSFRKFLIKFKTN